MSVDVHRRVESLAAQADALATAGRRIEAHDLYRDAAEAESEAFELVPATRRRTRGILAVSAVAYYRRAGAIRESIRMAHRFLGRDDLPEFARVQIEDLLILARQEQQASLAGQALAPQSLEVIL